MPGGQPTKYNAKMQKAADDYLTAFKSKHDDLLPTVEGMARVLGVTSRTLHNWADQEKNPVFFQSLERLKDIQKKMLFENGLTGDYNSTIAKLILSANHGVHEKQERGLTGADGGAIVIQEIRRTIVDQQ
jgi:hypothetical protein